MSYCRFSNTLSDLSECQDHLDEDIALLSEGERKARIRLLVLCTNIAADFAEEVEEYLENQRTKRQALK